METEVSSLGERLDLYCGVGPGRRYLAKYLNQILGSVVSKGLEVVSRRLVGRFARYGESPPKYLREAIPYWILYADPSILEASLRNIGFETNISPTRAQVLLTQIVLFETRLGNISNVLILGEAEEVDYAAIQAFRILALVQEKGFMDKGRPSKTRLYLYLISKPGSNDSWVVRNGVSIEEVKLYRMSVSPTDYQRYLECAEARYDRVIMQLTREFLGQTEV